MRRIYLAVIVLSAAATVIFALQNFEIVTISFLVLSYFGHSRSQIRPRILSLIWGARSFSPQPWSGACRAAPDFSTLGPFCLGTRGAGIWDSASASGRRCNTKLSSMRSRHGGAGPRYSRLRTGDEPLPRRGIHCVAWEIPSHR